MTLSEIEIILEELFKRHPDLSKEMLMTMLLSAGWEEKILKDALTLFSQKYPHHIKKVAPGPASVTPVSQQLRAPLTELGGERAKMTTQSQVAPVMREEKKGGWLFDFLGISFKEKHITNSPGSGSHALTAVLPTPEPHVEIPVLATPSSPLVSETSLVSAPSLVVVEQLPLSPPVLVHVREVPLVVVPPPQEIKAPSPLIAAESAHVVPQEETNWFLRFLGFSSKKSVSMQMTTTHAPLSIPSISKSAESHSPVPPLLTTVTPPPIQQEEHRQAPVQTILPSVSLAQEVIIPSLILTETVKPTDLPKKEVVIPDNLPLVPFESSPHVWSFSEYKDIYHKESAISLPGNPSLSALSSPILKINDEEILLEKTPMTKGDESLVFLASTMLFVIIIILGYMYSNGRL